MPEAIAAEIAAAYAALGEPAVAVRSSATAEDLPELSFAGQQETYLNVQGVPAVLAAVQRCWGSLWTPRAIGYRLQHGIDQQTVRLAVVVQRLIPAEAAGILFTADPVSGQRDRALISASWGLGEAVVGGLVTPDSLVVEKISGRVLNRQTADKQVMTARTASATEEQPVPETLRQAPVLDDAAAALLTALGVQIEQLYGQPMDIEWAWVDGRFFILQARPITALPAIETRAIDLAKAAARGDVWAHQFCRANPQPGLASFRHLWLAHGRYPHPRVDAAFYQGQGQIRLRPGQRLCVHGRRPELPGINDLHAYDGPDHRHGSARPGALPGCPPGVRPGDPGMAGQGYSRPVTQRTTRWRRYPLPGLRALLHATSRPAQCPSRRSAKPPSPSFITGWCAARATPRQRPSCLAQKRWLCAPKKRCLTWPPGAGSVPPWPTTCARPRPARWPRRSAQPQPPPGLSAEDWAAWQAQFQAYLAEHGQVTYDLDFANPVPAEQPTALLETIKMYLQGGGSDPYARHQATLERRAQATAAILARLRWPLKGWFQRLLRWAHETMPGREDSLADLGLGHPLIRRYLNELGRRLAAGGAIPDAGAIYWLEEAEVQELIAALEAGQPLPDLSGRIPPRRAEHQRYLKVTPPALLPEKSSLSALVPWHRTSDDQSALHGIGASAGRVTAPACVLFGPEDFHRMRPGDVLVAVTTTPAWTPLFAMASAVVTDIGGPLSHSSIVAREYGIPAVMAAGSATRRIQTGQIITVDGSNGTVTFNA